MSHALFDHHKCIQYGRDGIFSADRLVSVQYYTNLKALHTFRNTSLMKNIFRNDTTKMFILITLVAPTGLPFRVIYFSCNRKSTCFSKAFFFHLHRKQNSEKKKYKIGERASEREFERLDRGRSEKVRIQNHEKLLRIKISAAKMRKILVRFKILCRCRKMM